VARLADESPEPIETTEHRSLGGSQTEHGLLSFSGEAVVADAADFGARDSYPDVTITGNLVLELLVEAGFEFADLAAAEAGHMDVIARAVGFVVVAVTPKVEEVKLVDETFLFQQVDGAVDGDEMDFGADFLGAIEDLVDVEVLFGSVHDLENHATLAGKANAALPQGVLEMAGRFGDVDAFAARDAVGWHSDHEIIPKGSLAGEIQK